MERDLRLECLRLAAQVPSGDVLGEAGRYWHFISGESPIVRPSPHTQPSDTPSGQQP